MNADRRKSQITNDVRREDDVVFIGRKNFIIPRSHSIIQKIKHAIKQTLLSEAYFTLLDVNLY